MCFSTEASFGAAIALVPAGAYCVEAAWRKDRHYLLLGIVPLVFGLQQFCEALVWVGLGRAEPGLVRIAAMAYLFFALCVWPLWIPIAAAAIEVRPRRRLALLVMSGIGLVFGLVYYLPIAIDGGQGLDPTIIGHSIRYDLSDVPAIQSFWWWVGMVAYMVVVAGPFLTSTNHRLRPLAIGVLAAAIGTYVFLEYAFASVWCFFAAILSLYLMRVLYQLPNPVPAIHEPHLRPLPSS
jgi:hypothetical protein